MSPATPDPTRWLTDLMSTEPVLWPSLDVADTSKAFAAAAAPWTKAVADITKMQMDMLQQMAAPWLAAMPAAASTTEPIKDRRFAGEAWTKDPRFEAVARTYLAQAELMQQGAGRRPDRRAQQGPVGVRAAPGHRRAQPGEHAGDQPRGAAARDGDRRRQPGRGRCKLFTEDLAQGRISMTDETAFEVGRNVGTTPGTVVYQNELIQLIQYTPTTARGATSGRWSSCRRASTSTTSSTCSRRTRSSRTRSRRATPCSWCPGATPAPGRATLTWDDYLEQGVLTAPSTWRWRSPSADKANTLGFCIGGTLLASALAVRAARGEHPAASMTLLTTMLDFGDTGEIGLLVTDGGRGRARGGDRAAAACSRAASWRRCSPRCGRTT